MGGSAGGAARRDAHAMLEAAVEAADPEALMREALAGGPPAGGGGDGGVRLAALGKAAPGMARALAAAFPEAPGVLAAPREVLDRAGDAPEGWEAVGGGHPLPDRGSLEAGEALMEVARSTPEDGRLLVGMSGGGSACAEVAGVPLDDLRSVTASLLAAGLAVGEVNVVRRALSRLKGGGLARACPGEVRGFVLSDVMGDDLGDVASGPTVPLEPDPGEARRVLEASGLWTGAPAAVRTALEGGAEEGAGGAGVRNVLVGGNGTAVAGAAGAGRERGYREERLGEPLAGPAAEAGRELARRGLERRRAGERGLALVAGGEVTVAVEGGGRGGPCQEAAAAAAAAVEGEDVIVGVLDTDGVDGPTDAAGAVVDGATARRAREAGVDLEGALRRHDAHRLLEAAGDLVRTGPTGTNVNDVAVALVPGD